jgi:hypothetical protein
MVNITTTTSDPSFLKLRHWRWKYQKEDDSKSSGMWRRVDWQIVADVSKECSAFIFRVKQSKFLFTLLEGEEYKPSKRRQLCTSKHGVTSQKTCSFNNTAVRASNFVNRRFLRNVDIFIVEQVRYWAEFTPVHKETSAQATIAISLYSQYRSITREVPDSDLGQLMD